jgi:hypothetical protein
VYVGAASFSCGEEHRTAHFHSVSCDKQTSLPSWRCASDARRAIECSRCFRTRRCAQPNVSDAHLPPHLERRSGQAGQLDEGRGRADLVRRIDEEMCLETAVASQSDAANRRGPNIEARHIWSPSRPTTPSARRRPLLSGLSAFHQRAMDAERDAHEEHRAATTWSWLTVAAVGNCKRERQPPR